MSFSSLLPFLAALLSFGCALYLAPVVIRAALKYGIVDRPTTELKTHREPVPYLGGVVVFGAMLMALTITYTFDAQLLAILLASSLIVSVGLIDDLGTLTPRDKFIGQMFAAFVLVRAGIHTEIEVLPLFVNQAISMFWMLTCINAFNILDVSDGLAATSALTGAAALATIFALQGEPMHTLTAASMAGACGGFLVYNKQPARIYLGDTGSMLLGTLIGALTMSGSYSSQNWVSFICVPLVVMGPPFFDLGLVIMARLKKRIPIYHGSPDHYAVRLKTHGHSSRSVARITALISSIVLCAALLSSRHLGDMAAFAVTIGIGVVVIALWALLFIRFPPPADRRKNKGAARPDLTKEQIEKIDSLVPQSAELDKV